MEKVQTQNGIIKKSNTKKMVLLALMSTIAYLAVFVFRIPIIEFLSYEPKDAIIVIAGFIFGPLATIAISLVVSFLEMVTISTTGPIGLLMNIVASVCFAGVASFIYKKKKSRTSAIIGLLAGIVVMTIAMLLWNYIITPAYMGVEREYVAGMLVPVFLPFNLIKGALNSAIVMLVYKPVVTVLRKSNLLPKEEQVEKSSKKSTILQIAVSLMVILTIVLIVLAIRGVI